MGYNERKTATLGMPWGTANNRLRKNILFHLLKKHNENFCVRCKEEIESVDVLSIEHIKPWEGTSAELFWDLNNIAFSHLACNVPHKRTSAGPKLRKIGPPGTSWCMRHQAFISDDKFSSNKSRWSGLHSLCKECQHYMRDPNQLKQVQLGASVTGNTLGSEPRNSTFES